MNVALPFSSFYLFWFYLGHRVISSNLSGWVSHLSPSLEPHIIQNKKPCAMETFKIRDRQFCRSGLVTFCFFCFFLEKNFLCRFSISGPSKSLKNPPFLCPVVKEEGELSHGWAVYTSFVLLPWKSPSSSILQGRNLREVEAQSRVWMPLSLQDGFSVINLQLGLSLLLLFSGNNPECLFSVHPH